MLSTQHDYPAPHYVCYHMTTTGCQTPDQYNPVATYRFASVSDAIACLVRSAIHVFNRDNPTEVWPPNMTLTKLIWMLEHNQDTKEQDDDQDGHDEKDSWVIHECQPPSLVGQCVSLDNISIKDKFYEHANLSKACIDAMILSVEPDISSPPSISDSLYVSDSDDADDDADIDIESKYEDDDNGDVEANDNNNDLDTYDDPSGDDKEYDSGKESESGDDNDDVNDADSNWKPDEDDRDYEHNNDWENDHSTDDYENYGVPSMRVVEPI